MTLKKKILITVTAAVITRFVALVYWEGHVHALIERFSETDPTIVRKIHREIIIEALRGKYKDEDLDDNTVLDAVFHEKVRKLTEERS